MNHFYETLTNSRGDSLANYRVQVVRPALEGGGVVPIYADAGGTGFLDQLGLPVNYATADREGLVQFYWNARTGDILQILDPTGDLQKQVPGFADNYSREALIGLIQPILEDIAPNVAAANSVATALITYTFGYIGINDPFPPAATAEGEGYVYTLNGRVYGAVREGVRGDVKFEIATQAAIDEALSVAQAEVASFDTASSAKIIPGTSAAFVKDRRARFKRVATEPAHALKFNNGGWWEIDAPQLWDYMGGTDSGALQRVLDAAAAMGVRKVFASGSYTLTSALTIPPEVELDGNNRKLYIVQGNGANNSSFISLGANSALVGAVIDGNSQNNVCDDTKALVRIGNSGFAKVRNCLIRNTPSFGVVLNGGVNAEIVDNDFENVYSNGIGSFSLQNIDLNCQIAGNRFRQMGAGAAVFQSSRGVTFSRNFVKSALTGAPGARVRVSTSGTTVTMLNGNTSNIIPGMWMTIDGGKEFRIGAVLSSTEFTTTATLPQLTDVPAMMGTGDLFGCIAVQDVIIDSNHFEGAVTFGGGFSLAADGTQTGKSIVSGNLFKLCGKQGFNFAGEINGDFLTGEVRDITLSGNRFVDVGCGAGIGPSDLIAIYVSGNSGKVYNLTIANNSVHSTMPFGQNDGRTTYWFGTDGFAPVGSVSVSGNDTFGVLNEGIFNDIKVVLLSSDWGSMAFRELLYQNGDEVIVKITCSGTFTASGIGPQIAVQKIVDVPGARPVVNAKVIGTNFNNGANLFTMYGEDQSQRGNWIAYLNTVPAEGQSYTMSFKA